MAEDLTHTSGPLAAAAAEPTATLLSPPGYELLDEIGHGGMGIVYRARDTALDRDVAVKLLAERYPADSPAAQRFLSEARITGQLQHPGIPAVHQVGTLADGRPFLAMKLIKGSTLEAILKQNPSPLSLSPEYRGEGKPDSPLSPCTQGERGRGEGAAERGRLLAIFEAVCQAVGYAHAHRVIHRDLKPANVMVGTFGEVQVMDWGVAKVLGEETAAPADTRATEQTQAWTQVSSPPEAGSHTQAGTLVGTPAFIPPEQAVGEIEQVNERSDVFGLGAVLAVLLTGKPPYVGDTFEAVRVQAVRGKLEDCFARLDACGAEPELVALCKQCLAFEPADRPADAGALAQAVAGLRAAAEERARTAEREQAAAAAGSAERRKRRRLWLAAAAALAVAVVGGLTAVLAVQRRANADLAAKNSELADEQAKVEARNQELADEQAKVQERFELAQKAIALFHTGVSEDVLLRNAEFKELRTKLLKQAAGFYADLEKLLARQTDAKSRKALAAAYFELAELTDRIGDKKEALAVHRKALALRRELAAVPNADVETRLDVARSLEKVGQLLGATGDHAGALAAFEEERNLAERLEAEHPTDAVRSVLAGSHHRIGVVLWETGKPEEALAWNRKALVIQEKLARARPGGTEFQQGLAKIHNSMGILLWQAGNPEDARTAFGKTLAIQQKLADANPSVPGFQSGLAQSHNNIACVLMEQMGKLEEALTEFRKAQVIEQKLAEANRAVTEFQYSLAIYQNNIGEVLSAAGKPEEALTAYRKALAIRQKLVDANPAVPSVQSSLARSHYGIGNVMSHMGKPEEAMASYRKALAIWQKLVDANPAVTRFQGLLAQAHRDIARLLELTGKPEEAMEACRKALAIDLKLSNANPTVPDFQRDLATAHNNLGRLLARQKRFAEAFTHLDGGLAIRQNLAEANPKNTWYTNALGNSHAYRGWALVRSEQPSKAAADLRRAVELWAKAPDTETRLERSRTLALLAGLGGDAKTGVTTAEAVAFADQAVAGLRDAINAGWGWPDELKEPDFDALRGRDDFQKLLAEVEARQKARAAKKDAESK
jgi:serine/threonine protein kinase/tetratricopeptide (TPR) repeat protein